MAFIPSPYSEPISDWGRGGVSSGGENVAMAAEGVASTASMGAQGLKIGAVLAGGGGAAAAGAAVAGGGAAAAGGAVAAGGATTGLLTAAGASATIPVAGWIVGGVLAATAGTIALVKGIRQRKINKKRAIAWAKKLGLPDPEEVPGFVIKLARKPKDWRLKKLSVYKKRLSKVKERQRKWKRRPGARRTLQVFTLGIMRGPNRLKKQRARLEAKIALIEALEASYEERREERRERREEAKRQAAEQAQQVQEAATKAVEDASFQGQMTRKVAGAPVWGWLTLGALGVGAVLYSQANKSQSKGKTK